MDNIKEKEERLGSMLIDVLTENLGGFKVLFANKSAKTKEDMFSMMGRTAIRWCAQENNSDVLSNWNKPHVIKAVCEHNVFCRYQSMEDDRCDSPYKCQHKKAN
jgi:hypothetical protein